MTRQVWILNHFAVPQGEPGGTRHTELFAMLTDWEYLIFAARNNPTTRKRQRDHVGFRFVPVTSYSSNGISRILNWASYAVNATTYAVAAGIRKRPHVIYASSPHLLAGLAGATLARFFRVPLVLEIRDLWPKVLVDMGQVSECSLVYRILRQLELRLYAEAMRVVVLTEGVRRALVEQGIPENQIVLIPNAADPSFFVVGSDRDEDRSELGFRGFTFIYAGAHGPANGLDLVLDAARELRTQGRNDISIALVGDGLERVRLMNQARADGLTNVTFREPVAKSEVPRLLHAADAGLHCLADLPLFRYGVSPNKIFDYMAAGLPVLTNTPGEMAALIATARSGVATQPSGLADGMKQLADASFEARTAWGEAGISFMSEHQSRSAMARRLHGLLSSVAGQPR